MSLDGVDDLHRVDDLDPALVGRRFGIREGKPGGLGGDVHRRLLAGR
jgi:hypothetical protein